MESKRVAFEDAILRAEALAESLGLESAAYWKLHAARFRSITAQIAAAASQSGDSRPFRVLDIGNSYQTVLFEQVAPEARIDTMGFHDHRFALSRPSRHYQYDLNESAEPATWPEPIAGPYDLITFLEVIEHLPTSPSHVLRMLRTFLSARGALVIQTPNAVALKKRIALLAGRNPFERIRTDRRNPGHFREYTLKELRLYAQEAGFRVCDARLDSFLVDGKPVDRLCDRLSRWLPPNFRNGITVTLRLQGPE